jgi:hypothetical protein
MRYDTYLYSLLVHDGICSLSSGEDSGGPIFDWEGKQVEAVS